MPPLTQAGPVRAHAARGLLPLDRSPSPLQGLHGCSWAPLRQGVAVGGGQERWKGVGQRATGRGACWSAASLLSPTSQPGALWQLGGACAPGRCGLWVTERSSSRPPAQQSGARGEGASGPRGLAARKASRGRGRCRTRGPRAPQTCAARRPHPASCREAGPPPSARRRVPGWAPTRVRRWAATGWPRR